LIFLIVGGYFLWMFLDDRPARLAGAAQPGTEAPERIAAAATAKPTQTNVLPPALTVSPTATLTLTPTASPTPTRTVTPRVISTPVDYQWAYETVDSTSQVGVFSSLVMGRRDIPNIAYLDDGKDKLKFATLTNGKWVTVLLPDKDRAGWYASTAIDSRDNIYIAYYVFDKKRISYLYKFGAPWNPGASIPNTNVASSAMALDPQDQLVIVFLDKKDGSLAYAAQSSGGWRVNPLANAYPTAASFPEEGAKVAVAIDGSGRIHIAFTSVEGLKYAMIDGGAVNIETIVTGKGAGLFPSLALDGEGYPLVAFYAAPEQALKLAEKSGGRWESRVVDQEGDPGRHASLKVDAGGMIHIAYYQKQANALVYAQVTGSQVKTTLLDTGGVGTYTSLALDSHSLPHISYYDGKNQNLKYAWASQRTP
jgi:hypothetical protein